jgi:hypothetical protein
MKTKEEIEILRADAIAGDAVAQNDLGCAYSSGDGVAKNLKEAFTWFERSAKQGNKYGQYNTGRYYQYGYGVGKNICLAIEWYEKSANQGFGKAANMLGEIYEKGYYPNISVYSFNSDDITSIEPNPEEAFYWYKKGKNSEDLAKFNLGRCYELGIGTPKSLFMACKLYTDCKDEKAQEKLNLIKQTYNPILDTSLQNIEIFGNNPYRILGVWSNSSEREIRANQSKIEALSKVGKVTSFELDHLIPCDIADFIQHYSNIIKYLEDGLDKSYIANREAVENNIKRCKETLNEWNNVEQHSPIWNIYPNRTIENLTNAKTKLASAKERIKYALFWFCNYTSNDEQALKLLSEHKWYEAGKIWFHKINFSAYINDAVLQWAERNYFSAIISILNLIHKESFRKEFVSTISNGTIELSEEELSQMFWDALYEFPETELSTQDILRYGCEVNLNPKILTEKDKEYIRKKGFDIIESPIKDMLRAASNQDENNFEEGRKIYDKIVKEAPTVLTRIKRLAGDNNYRYKLLCNEIAEKLLDYAIHYNNDNKDEWNASAIALGYANYALTIVKDDNLRERCEENISIFKTNKQSATLHYIETRFNEFRASNVNISEVEKLYSDVHLQVGRIKTLAGKESELYKNVSDRVVNEILNILISICNKHKDASTASSASSIIKKMKEMYMSQETKLRIDKNYSILSNNMMAAIRRGNFGDLGDSGKTYSKEENKSRRIHKVWATIGSVVAFVLMWYYMSWNNNLQYFMETMPLWGYICIIIMVFIALFPIIMWGLEFQKDPHNTRLYWLDNSVESLYNLSNDIMRAGVQGRKTYSWPFAIPFQLLGIAIWILSFPIKGMAKLAAMIK